MLFGASYYHEYHRSERLDEDLRLMLDAGFTVIRVGESTWSSYEPRNGDITFDALGRVVDAAHERGLKVVVGTPTYAIPPWLAREHPEVMGHRSSGSPVPYGHRQNVDYSHPVLRWHAERVIRAMARRFGHHPAVIGWQVDNETGTFRLHNPNVIERFRDHVMAEVGSGDVEVVNQRWGLTYWSHRLADRADIWPPDGNSTPGYDLQWARFQRQLTTDFLSWQRDLLREDIDAGQWVLQDVVGHPDMAAVDGRAISEAMDVTGVNIYVAHQEGLALPAPEHPERWAPEWSPAAGAYAAVARADVAWSYRGPQGSAFLVTETQATSIGGSATNITPYPGQLRLMAHLLAGRGARMICYWHWHSLPYGAETYWGGVLGHDLLPNRTYAEVSALGAELAAIGPLFEGAVPDADLGMLFSRDSLDALQFQPALTRPGSPDADPRTYLRIFEHFHAAATDARLQVRVSHVDADADWSGTPVLVVPALYIADDALLTRIEQHAADGGHVVLTFRSAVADTWATVRAGRAPDLLRGGVGGSYQEFSNLPKRVPLQPQSIAGLPTPAWPATPVATGWADGLIPETATVIAGYDHPFHGRFAAITTREVGCGRITWVGTLPDPASTAALLRWAVDTAGRTPLTDRWAALPIRVRVASSTRPDGTVLWTVANHGWEPATVTPPHGLNLAGPPGRGTRADRGALTLGPWDSIVLTES